MYHWLRVKHVDKIIYRHIRSRTILAHLIQQGLSENSPKIHQDPWKSIKIHQHRWISYWNILKSLESPVEIVFFSSWTSAILSSLSAAPKEPGKGDRGPVPPHGDSSHRALAWSRVPQGETGPTRWGSKVLLKRNTVMPGGKVCVDWIDGCMSWDWVSLSPCHEFLGSQAQVQHVARYSLAISGIISLSLYEFLDVFSLCVCNVASWPSWFAALSKQHSSRP